MVVTKLKKPKRKVSALRIESVDNWHDAWPAVRAHVARFGDDDKLRIDEDGWLSSRQILLVAFIGRQVAAHLCFSVNPGTKCIEATLDSRGVSPRFADRGLAEKLYQAAQARAESLGCEKLKGFK